MALSETEKAKRRLPENNAKAVAYAREWRNKTDYNTNWYRTHKEKRKEINAGIRERNPIQWLLYKAKSRAKSNGLPFVITWEDIEKPTHCPVMGMKLNYLGSVGSGGSKPANTASLDRIIPSLGYVKGNVIVVSCRANELKRDATLVEMKALVAFYEKIL